MNLDEKKKTLQFSFLVTLYFHRVILSYDSIKNKKDIKKSYLFPLCHLKFIKDKIRMKQEKVSLPTKKKSSFAPAKFENKKKMFPLLSFLK